MSSMMLWQARAGAAFRGAAAVCLLGACGCAPQGGHSDDCYAPSWGKEPVTLFVTQVDASGVPSLSLDLKVSRPPGAAFSAVLELSTQTHAGWCGSSYAGALTYAQTGLPAGATAVFAPATLPAAVSYAPRISTLTLSFPAAVADGTYPLRFLAAEGPVDAPAYRLIVSTLP